MLAELSDTSAVTGVNLFHLLELKLGVDSTKAAAAGIAAAGHAEEPAVSPLSALSAAAAAPAPALGGPSIDLESFERGLLQLALARRATLPEGCRAAGAGAGDAGWVVSVGSVAAGLPRALMGAVSDDLTALLAQVWRSSRLPLRPIVPRRALFPRLACVDDPCARACLGLVDQAGLAASTVVPTLATAKVPGLPWPPVPPTAGNEPPLATVPALLRAGLFGGLSGADPMSPTAKALRGQLEALLPHLVKVND